MPALLALSQNHSGMKRPQVVSGASSCLEQSLLWGQARLLRALSSQASKSAKGGQSMTSQGNLLKCLALLRVQFLSSHLVGSSSASIYAFFPPYLSMVHHLQNHPIVTGVLLGAPAAAFFRSWTSPGPSGCPSQGPILLASRWTHLSVSMSFLFWGGGGVWV